MKKTLFATISILLMLFAFVACDGSNPGPTGGDVTGSEANTLAGTYFGSINFSQLIVDAFDDTVTTIDVASLSKDGFTIEFDKYAGEALSKTTATTPANKAAATDDSATEEKEPVTITEITSGTIEFTFTTANSKTTYTAKTAADDPIVFKGAPEGADLAFDITGEANISFTRFGTDGAITNLASESTVKIGAPDATKSTISVGGTSVDYDDIKESAKNGFDKTATAPEVVVEGGETTGSYTKQQAISDLTKILDDISRDKVKNDFITGLMNRLIAQDGSDAIKEVTLDSYSINYRGEKSAKAESLIKGLLQQYAQQGKVSTLAEGTEDKELEAIKANLYDVSIDMKISFDYYNAFKDTAAVAGRINSGTVNFTIKLGRGDETEGTLEGTYVLNTEKPLVISTKDTADTYSVEIKNFGSKFSLSAKEKEIWVPAADDSTVTISVSKNGASAGELNWADIELQGGTNYEKKTAELLDAEYFYQHFGSLRFLNALYAAFNNDKGNAGDTYNNLTISEYTKNNGIELGGEDTSKTLALTVDFGDGYRYYRGSDSYQTVSGEATFTFTGSVENSEFTATSFTVDAASLALSDSSSNNKRPAATATITNASGKFGDGDNSNGNIVFTLNDKTAVTGITNYQADESKYNDDTNEFVLTAEGGITSIAITLK